MKRAGSRKAISGGRSSAESAATPKSLMALWSACIQKSLPIMRRSWNAAMNTESLLFKLMTAADTSGARSRRVMRKDRG